MLRSFHFLRFHRKVQLVWLNGYANKENLKAFSKQFIVNRVGFRLLDNFRRLSQILATSAAIWVEKKKKQIANKNH